MLFICTSYFADGDFGDFAQFGNSSNAAAARFYFKTFLLKSLL